MKRLGFYALVLYFVLLYTCGLWGRLGVPNIAVEAALFALPLVTLLHRQGALGRPAPGFLFVWFYLGWSFCACLYNGESFARGLLYPRFLVATYIVFWAVWNARFAAGQIFWLNRVIIALFLLQVPAALFEWLVVGELTEAIVGTMEYQAGAIAATFPMFAFSCLLAFFLYYGRAIFLVLAFSFFLVGYASSKLAVYYFIPAMLVLGLMLYAAAEGLPSVVRRASLTALVGCCALPFIVYLLSHTARTERLQEESGIHHKVESFLAYTQETTLESQSWYTATRVSTSWRVIEETFRRSSSVFLFGQGPSVFREMSGQADEGAYDEYGIIYGLVGWSADALAVGWPAMIAHAGFYIYLFRLLRRRKRTLCLDTYWKAIVLTAELGFFVFLITYFLYSRTFTIRGWLSSVYLYFLAVLLAPQYQEILATHPVPWRGKGSTLLRGSLRQRYGTKAVGRKRGETPAPARCVQNGGEQVWCSGELPHDIWSKERLRGFYHPTM
jgi:hypothetical protein